MNILESLNRGLEQKYHLNEAKEDKEKFLQFAGQDLYDRFELLKSKRIIRGQDADYTYWEKQSVDALRDFIDSTEAKQEEKNKERTAVKQHYRQISDLIEWRDYKVIYEGNGWTIYEVLTHKASMWFGKDTKWCITMKDNPTYFNQYKNKGANYYFLIPDKNPETNKWCYLYYGKTLSLSDEHFWDARDKAHTITKVDIPENVLLPLPGISQKTLDDIEGKKPRTYIYNPSDNKEDIDFSEIERVVIPNNVIKIEDYAFAGCENLEEVKISDGVKEIGDYAFCGCNFKEFVMPNSIKKLGIGVFEDCEELEKIVLSDNITKLEDDIDWGTGGGICCRCHSLSDIKFPSNLTYIGTGSFIGTAITTLNILNKVTEIGDGAFNSCRELKTVYIPSSCQKIGRGAFGDWWGGFDSVVLSNIYVKGKYRPEMFDKYCFWDEYEAGDSDIIDKANKITVTWVNVDGGKTETLAEMYGLNN